MKILFSTAVIAAASLLPLAAHAAPRQAVLIVSEGASTESLDFGRSYIKTGFDADTDVALDALRGEAKSIAAPGDVSQARGLLKAAEANGWRTGFVTTGDAATVGGLLYDVTGATALLASGADFIAGGGRASFSEADRKGVSDGGGTLITDMEGLDAAPKGQVVALSYEGEGSYTLDHDAEKEPTLSELAALGMEALGRSGEAETPFLLVVHDTLGKKALEARDTPALVEQAREVDAVIADALGKRADNPDFVVALWATGAASAPRWTTADANERSNGAAILSQLPVSFSGAGSQLKGADDAKIKLFATDTYKGWQLSDADRAAIVGGTLDAEKAIRASYEPALKIEIAPIPSAPMLHVAGLAPGADALATLQALASSAPTAPAPTP